MLAISCVQTQRLRRLLEQIIPRRLDIVPEEDKTDKEGAKANKVAD